MTLERQFRGISTVCRELSGVFTLFLQCYTLLYVGYTNEVRVESFEFRV